MSLIRPISVTYSEDDLRKNSRKKSAHGINDVRRNSSANENNEILTAKKNAKYMRVFSPPAPKNCSPNESVSTANDPENWKDQNWSKQSKENTDSGFNRNRTPIKGILKNYDRSGGFNSLPSWKNTNLPRSRNSYVSDRSFQDDSEADPKHYLSDDNEDTDEYENNNDDNDNIGTDGDSFSNLTDAKHRTQSSKHMKTSSDNESDDNDLVALKSLRKSKVDYYFACLIQIFTFVYFKSESILSKAYL